MIKVVEYDRMKDGKRTLKSKKNKHWKKGISRSAVFNKYNEMVDKCTVHAVYLYLALH